MRRAGMTAFRCELGDKGQRGGPNRRCAQRNPGWTSIRAPCQSNCMQTNTFLWRPCAAALALTLACAVGSGCATLWNHDKPITVDESQLNWLEIAYRPGMGKPLVQLSLLGSGNIRLKRGTSPQISNDFSQDVDNVLWDDVNVDQLNVQTSQMRDVFQALVNRGLMQEPDKDFLESAKRGVPEARITGMLNNERVKRLAVEPELIGYIRELLRLFDENKQLPAAKKPEPRIE